MKKAFGRILVLGLSLGISAAAYGGDLTSTIIGGSDVSPNDPIAKMTVLLVAQTGQQQYVCSGSIIAKNIVLTAAHCVSPAPDAMVAIFSTNVATATKANAIPVVTGIANPGWVGDTNGAVKGVDAHDLALVLLSQNIPAGYQPAKFMPQTTKLSAGESVVVAGYGLAESPDKDPKGTTVGTLRTVSISIDGAVGKTEIGLDESEGKGSCSGDSGGPAYVRKGSQLLLWGVTSRGDEECSQEIIYTDVEPYLSWIKSTEAKLQQFAQKQAQSPTNAN